MAPAISPGQKAAILEAFHAAVALIPKDLRGGFVLVGGACLLTLGSDRKTEDVDVAVTPPSLHAAANDSRLKEDFSDNWQLRYHGPF